MNIKICIEVHMVSIVSFDICNGYSARNPDMELGRDDGNDTRTMIIGIYVQSKYT